jgi:hypothetical protein
MPTRYTQIVLFVGTLALLALPTSVRAEEDRAAEIDLPRVGTLGQAPTGEDTILLTVTGDGAIRVDGEGPLSLLGLRNRLREKTADRRWREADHSSRKQLLVNADASLPWIVSQWVMMVAADPTVQLYKIFFGARPREGDARGAIGWTLPKDRGLQPTAQQVEDVPRITAKIVMNDLPPSDPEALLPHLQQLRAALGGGSGIRFEIQTPPPRGGSVPTGFVVRVVDVAARAGFAHILFEGAPMSAGAEMAEDVEALRRFVARLEAREGTPTLRVGGRTVGQRPAGAPAPAGRGLLPTRYGIGLASRAEGSEEELVEEEPLDAAPPGEPLEEEIEEEIEEESASGGDIGLGGGAGGAFRGRGGSRDLGARASRRERAVEDALLWLAAHQSPSGGWEAAGFGAWCEGEPASEGLDGMGRAVHDVGVTGLALCAFLGAGYTNRGSHPFAKVVGKGLRALKLAQDAEGCFGPRSSPQHVYGHATAALAMVEAYGLTQSPLFKGSAQRALDFLALSRNPYFAWRYGVKPGDNDTSVTAWMTAVLATARAINEHARELGKPPPLRIDEQAFEGVRAWIDKMTDPDHGRTGYVQRGSTPARPQALVDAFPGDASEAMTAAGIVTRVLCGETPSSTIIQKGAALCLRLPPTWNPANGRIDMVYWYFGTAATYLVGGASWEAWRPALDEAVLDHQRADTTPCLYRGSWDPVGPWGPDGGRVYSTALMALCLQTEKRVERPSGSGSR